MNHSIILEFLEKYKNLDELCRQILSSDRGISEYINKMECESQGRRLVNGWERDYKGLKRMRWIRNCLVHETDSFDKNLVNESDIEWLHKFYQRIMECTDPFSLLHRAVKINRSGYKQQNYQDNYLFTDRASRSRNEELSLGPIILAAMIIALLILLGIAIICILCCF